MGACSLSRTFCPSKAQMALLKSIWSGVVEIDLEGTQLRMQAAGNNASPRKILGGWHALSST